MKCLTPIILPNSNMTFPCGKCYNCCVNYSRQWALRMLHEASLHVNNCMITLTYAETDGDLHKDHFQKFMKRLRKRIAPIKVRYFACGEYGGKNNRPHYHVILFGWIPEDIERVKYTNYYSSKFLADVWGYGFVSLSDITYENLIYCAKYLTKLDTRYHFVKPFTVMSRKPGIGYGYVNPDLLNHSVIYDTGKRFGVPKYYYKVLEKQGYNLDIVKSRKLEFVKNLNSEYLDPDELMKLKVENDIKLKQLFSDKKR